jgi:hypothetical protein
MIRQKGNGPSCQEEKGQGKKENKDIPPLGFCKAPPGKVFNPPEQVTQERQGGQGKGKKPEKFPVY